MIIDANDPSLASFVAVDSQSHFPIQNLPFGVGVILKEQGAGYLKARCLSRIGDYAIDLAVLESQDYFKEQIQQKNIFNQPNLNGFLQLGQPVWRALRQRLSLLLRANSAELKLDSALAQKILVPIDQVKMVYPLDTRNYVDFYSSKFHAFNVGCLFRGPDNALQPNWVHLPVGYHGRASTLSVDQQVKRPFGQIKLPDQGQPVFSACRKLDIELEVAVVIGQSNEAGKAIHPDKAEEHIFGLALMNDWSARDIQAWEYVPLGPFLAKNFSTTIAPWIVTLDALAPFRCNAPIQEPAPLDYLTESNRQQFDIQLSVAYQTPEMSQTEQIAQTNHKYLYWTPSQQLAHLTVGGCVSEVGDLLGSGTISGPEKNMLGCLLEMTENGKHPVSFSNGEFRHFLEDGDKVILSGYAQGAGFRVGFGDLPGTILPADQ